MHFHAVCAGQPWVGGAGGPAVPRRGQSINLELFINCWGESELNAARPNGLTRLPANLPATTAHCRCLKVMVFLDAVCADQPWVGGAGGQRWRGGGPAAAAAPA